VFDTYPALSVALLAFAFTIVSAVFSHFVVRPSRFTFWAVLSSIVLLLTSATLFSGPMPVLGLPTLIVSVVVLSYTRYKIMGTWR